MSGGYRRGQPPTDLADVLDAFEEVDRRLGELEAPSGEQLAQVVKELGTLVDNISARLDDYIANDAYTKAQVDALVASPGAIAPTSVDISGPLDVAGQIVAPATLLFTNANFRTVTVGDLGEYGVSSSSARYKQDIVDADVPDELFRSIAPRRFRYRSQVDVEGAAAPFDVGFIAEELDAAGITEPVFYDAEGRPEGINYDRLTPFLWAVVRRLVDRVDTLEGPGA